MPKTNYFLNKFRAKPQIANFDNGFQDKFFAEDPLFVGFSVYFDRFSPLLNDKSSFTEESAERFFINNDDPLRASYVKEFRERLLKLVDEHQYYFQSVSGLNTLYSRAKGGDEIELTFEMLESLDMRITKLKELYHKITWDYRREKELLPENLRWINLRILVNDGRNIGRYLNGELIDVTPSLDTLIYTVNSCQFDFTEGHDFLETINNAEPEVSLNSMKIVGGYSHMDESRVSLVEVLSNSADGASGFRSQTKMISVENEKLEARKKLQMESDREIQNVENKTLKNQLLQIGESVANDFENAAKREIRQQLIERLISDFVEPSKLNNVFFRGKLAEAVNTKDATKFLQAAVSGGALPNLDETIVSLILDGEKLSPSESMVLYSEILDVNEKDLGNKFE